MAQGKKNPDAIAKKRSEAARKAAATRKAKEQEQEQSGEQSTVPEEPRRFAGMNQNAAEERRQAELAEARQYRNQKLGIG